MVFNHARGVFLSKKQIIVQEKKKDLCELFLSKKNQKRKKNQELVTIINFKNEKIEFHFLTRLKKLYFENNARHKFLNSTKKRTTKFDFIFFAVNSREDKKIRILELQGSLF